MLRLGHRPGRDPRLTTHVALAARALGAEGMYLAPPDRALSERLEAVRRRWGGSFAVENVASWKAVVLHWPGAVVHLTMYGEPIDSVVPRLSGAKRVLLVVGGAKVPPELYRLATYNASVGSQPHSEVAAVAIALDRLRGPPTRRSPRGSRLRIVPQARGKRVEGADR